MIVLIIFLNRILELLTWESRWLFLKETKSIWNIFLLEKEAELGQLHVKVNILNNSIATLNISFMKRKI